MESELKLKQPTEIAFGTVYVGNLMCYVDALTQHNRYGEVN